MTGCVEQCSRADTILALIFSPPVSRATAPEQNVLAFKKQQNSCILPSPCPDTKSKTTAWNRIRGKAASDARIFFPKTSESRVNGIRLFAKLSFIDCAI